MTPIDQMIKILIRVKNCDKALNNLKKASQNIIFQKEINNLDEKESKYLNHVKSLIEESIELIEND